MRKKIGPFSSYYRALQTPRDNFLGCTRSLENYCAKYKILSLGPKKSIETNLFKFKAIVPVKKIFGIPLISTTLTDTEYFLLGSRWYFSNYGASYIIISLTPKRLLTTQILEKKASLPMKKLFRPNFSPNIEHYKPLETFFKGPEGILANTVELMTSFL